MLSEGFFPANYDAIRYHWLSFLPFPSYLRSQYFHPPSIHGNESEFLPDGSLQKDANLHSAGNLVAWLLLATLYRQFSLVTGLIASNCLLNPYTPSALLSPDFVHGTDISGYILVGG